MIAPEALLRMRPLDALRAQIGENLKAPLKAEYLRIGTPVSLGGTLTQVMVELDRCTTPLHLWERAGMYEFVYNRISLSDFTAGLNTSVASTVPTTSKRMFSGLLSPYGIPVVDEDIISAELSTIGKVSILAADASYRWVGAVDMTILMLAIEISTLILVNRFPIAFTSAYSSASIPTTLAMYLTMVNGHAFPVPVDASMFTVGTPVVNNAIDAGDNTRLPLTFSGIPYTDTVDVYYARKGFEYTFRRPIVIAGPQVADKIELATELSAQMGCLILPGDIQSEPFPSLAVGSSEELAVNFNITSLGYVGAILVKYSRTV